MQPIIRTALAATLAVSLQPHFAAALAADPARIYPDRPIRFVVGQTPGSSIDTMSRIIATRMSELLGHQLVVDNRTGAGGLIAGEIVAFAVPDGYTLLMGSSGTLTVGPNVFPNWPHDPIKGITPISNVQFVPLVLVVKADSPIKSVQELVQLAKEKPGQIAAAGAGLGTANHLAAELFQMLTHTKFLLVHYRGAAPAMNDLIAGHVQFFFDQASTTVPQVQGGTIRALAVTSPKRWPRFKSRPATASSTAARRTRAIRRSPSSSTRRRSGKPWTRSSMRPS